MNITFWAHSFLAKPSLLQRKINIKYSIFLKKSTNVKNLIRTLPPPQNNNNNKKKIQEGVAEIEKKKFSIRKKIFSFMKAAKFSW